MEETKSEQSEKLLQESQEDDDDVQHEDNLKIAPGTKSLEFSLKERQKSILTALKDYRSKNALDLLWFVIWIAVLAVSIYIKKNIWVQLNVWKSIIFYSTVLISFSGIFNKLICLSKNRKTKVDSYFELSIIEDDIFLEEIKGLNYEEKARKQLSKQQVEIERYHSLNLAHTKIIFAIGVFIIFIGIGIIACTIIVTFISEYSVQLIVIASGFIGGLMVDAVGAIFILMYSKTIESANEYLKNMVETANTYLGNVLVSQIGDNELREETLSVMAKELVHRCQANDAIKE